MVQLKIFPLRKTEFSNFLDWYGLLYSFSDKKKSNLMLSILQPSSVTNPIAIPWIGDFRFLGLLQDSLPEGSLGYPVRTEKKSYSSGNMSWLKESALQSDFTKLLRHGEFPLNANTQHFQLSHFQPRRCPKRPRSFTKNSTGSAETPSRWDLKPS